MRVAKLNPVAEFDLGRAMVPWDKRRAEGKSLRQTIPRGHEALVATIRRGQVKAVLQSDDES
jgi:hypothetical protein